MATTTIHNSSATGFSDATTYDAHRPSYPTEAVELMLQKAQIAGASGAKVVDLAAGTGKLTEGLAARPEGYEIIAVEPHDKMRETLESKKLKGVSVKNGTAQEMGLEQGWADVVVVAQAFHWFANDEALREIHNTLKTNGVLVMIWNVDEYNKPRDWQASTKWEQQLNDLVLQTATDGQPRFRDQAWKGAFRPDSNLFTTPLREDTTTEWTVKLTREGVWDRLRTLSHIAMLEGEERQAFRGRFDKIMEGAGEGDVVEMHGRTAFWWTTKKNL